jgi:hypothetical protein
MNYLGGLRGDGFLVCGDLPLARAQYDFDGYLSEAGEVTSCGEIRLSASALKGVFGRTDVQLKTADGRLLRLRFSEKRLSSDDCAAHVDLVGGLPAAADWQRRSGRRDSGPITTKRPRYARPFRASREA